MKKIFCFLILAFMVNNAVAGCAAVDRAAFVLAAKTALADTEAYGFGNAMWASMVDESGRICHIAAVEPAVLRGKNPTSRKVWLGGRVMSAQKAFTANAFSTTEMAMSSGYLYYATVPNGFLYGLQHSNPIHTGKAYAGSPIYYGKLTDRLIGKRVGGLSVTGGGVALYGGSKLGAIGAAGDTSCRNHMFAYRMRIALGLANAPTDDGLILVDTGVADPAALAEHPQCGGAEEEAANDVLGDGNTHDASDFGVRNLPAP